MPFFRISGCDPIASYCIIMYFSSIFIIIKIRKGVDRNIDRLYNPSEIH